MNSRSCKFLVVILILSLFFAASSQAKGLFAKSEEQAESAEQAEPATTEAEQPAASNARIKFDALEHDFGNIAPESYSDCNFTFTNAGSDILKIDRVHGTCKCTVPDLEKKEYAPGESGQISVQFHAPKYQGPTTQHLTVFSSDSNSPRVQLAIKAYVELKVAVTPDQMTLSLIAPDGGPRLEGREACGISPITLESTDGEKFAVTKAESTGDVVSIAFDPNNVSEKHILNPVVNLENLKKSLNGFIILTLNHPHCKSIRVQYSSLKEFETSPSVIIIRNAVVGEIQKRTIYLTSNYSQPIEIESISSDKGIIKVISQEQTENQYKLVAEIAPPLQEGQLRVFSDTLHIKLKEKEPIDISCRGFYKTDK
ncbi:MAG: hypothetical protein CVV39_07330 [Planctomycetes bacterium HGW-Planctomycetes-1]|nr:MAG: hypothetical protein CVV39_07330 [Planctomycetes bacterium HGW-Planctomycetes-1]